ncbi:hypothetical protein CD107_05535, partial [Mammaliicoccus vitulinus]
DIINLKILYCSRFEGVFNLLYEYYKNDKFTLVYFYSYTITNFFKVSKVFAFTNDQKLYIM